jgi:hypothetical protein
MVVYIHRRILSSLNTRLGVLAAKKTISLLYLNFPLTLSGSKGMGRWDCPAACRRQDSGAGELVSLWHWLLARCVRSMSRSCLCPKLEPLIERPTKASSHLQE